MSGRRARALLVLGLGLGCAHAPPPSAPAPLSAPTSVAPSTSQSEEGNASWYGPGLYGRKTASGEVLRPGTMTAAHRTLAFGTCLHVVNLENGRTVQVTVNDRGPFADDRIVDLSEAAAGVLGIRARGVARVRLERC